MMRNFRNKPKDNFPCIIPWEAKLLDPYAARVRFCRAILDARIAELERMNRMLTKSEELRFKMYANRLYGKYSSAQIQAASVYNSNFNLNNWGQPT